MGQAWKTHAVPQTTAMQARREVPSTRGASQALFCAVESLWHPMGPAGDPGALRLVGPLLLSVNPKAVHLAQPSFLLLCFILIGSLNLCPSTWDPTCWAIRFIGFMGSRESSTNIAAVT